MWQIWSAATQCISGLVQSCRRPNGLHVMARNAIPPSATIGRTCGAQIRLLAIPTSLELSTVVSATTFSFVSAMMQAAVVCTNTRSFNNGSEACSRASMFMRRSRWRLAWVTWLVTSHLASLSKVDRTGASYRNPLARSNRPAGREGVGGRIGLGRKNDTSHI